MKLFTTSVALVLLSAASSAADTVDDLRRLVELPGISGHETPIRDFLELRLPPWARPRADNLGNLLLRLGNSGPHTLIVASLDEPGLVVSAITDDGYLRVHRHTTPAGPPLATQYLLGQPVQIVKADGVRVNGVIATPSTHLRSFLPSAEVARVNTLDDVWVDVGVTSRTAVDTLGIRMLDSVTLRERATRLAGGTVAGVAASPRAGTLALARIVTDLTERPAVQGRQVTLAWVAQSHFNNRGLLRLLESLKPDRVIVVRSTPMLADDPRGASGRLGGGPLIAGADAELQKIAQTAGVPVQTVPPERLRMNLPEEWKALALHTVSVPALFAQTPVETVDARDVEALASLLASVAGLPAPAAASGSRTTPPTGNGEGTPDARVRAIDLEFITLQPLIESYGVSGHEAPVREGILEALPSWAKPQVDERGNVSVTFGQGGRPLVFVAHMDEVGFELTEIAADGSASVRTRGGMYLSLYEAHPMLVMTPKGRVPAIMAPRRGYASSKTSQPGIDELSLFFGTDSAAATRALGVDVGQSATIEKTFAHLGDGRATGRSMDDRAGCAALLLALRQIDPTTVQNTVTFAWVVEEETGLAGAAFMASRAPAPHTAFAIDTFVSNDSPVDTQRLAAARLGQGAVLRGMDSRTLVRPEVIDRITAIAKSAKIPLQIGVTSGGTDASAFSAGGAIDVGLSWPGKYSHSPVEVLDRRDLAALAQLIALLAAAY